MGKEAKKELIKELDKLIFYLIKNDVKNVKS